VIEDGIGQWFIPQIAPSVCTHPFDLERDDVSVCQRIGTGQLEEPITIHIRIANCVSESWRHSKEAPGQSVCESYDRILGWSETSVTRKQPRNDCSREQSDRWMDELVNDWQGDRHVSMSCARYLGSGQVPFDLQL
jgi:hypothetical protein